MTNPIPIAKDVLQFVPLVENGLSQTTSPFAAMVVGPFIAWFGYRSKDMPEWSRFALVVIGVHIALRSYWLRQFRQQAGAGGQV